MTPPTRGLFRKSSFTAFTLTLDASGEFAQLVDRMTEVAAHPETIAKLIREAMIETILPAVRERFIQALPNAMEMEVENPLRGALKVPRARNTDEMHSLSAAYARLTDALGGGDAKAIEHARETITHAEDAMRTALNRSPNGSTIKPSSLSSGLFRTFALRVLQVMTDAAVIDVVHETDAISFGIGNLQILQAIRTPSATQYVLNRGQTGSPYDTMWRHLEYGTGVYATDPEGKTHPPTRYSAPMGGGKWIYSQRPPKGPMFRGQKGVHALRSATGTAYGEDAQQFNDAIALSLGRVLGPTFSRS